MFFVSQNFEHINKLTGSKQNHKRKKYEQSSVTSSIDSNKTIEYETLVKPLYFHYVRHWD